MRRLLVLAFLTALGAALPLAATAAKPTFALSRLGAGGAPFPERAYLLSFPGSAPTHVRVHVTENGQRVSTPTSIPALLAKPNQLAVVLVIDTSKSMQGKGIKNAMAAARAFAARRNPRQQIGVVAFDKTVRVLLPFTKDDAAIYGALSQTPQLHFGSHIFDALERSARLFDESKIQSGSIILLSDGVDVGSNTSRKQAAAAVAAAHAQVYSVGLRSHTFDPATLRAIARNSGGSFAVARSPDQLPAIYDRLGFQLANAWILQYRSLVGPKRHVRVAVRVEGYRGTRYTTYVSPALHPPPSAPFHLSAWWTIWRSPATFALIALLSASLIAVGLITALRHGVDPGVRRRVAEFVSLAPAATEGEDPAPDASAPTGLSLRRLSWWERLREHLILAEISVSAERLVGGTLAATLLFGLFLWVVVGHFAAVLALLVPLAVRMFVQRKLAAKRNAFVEQLPDNLAVLAGALRAGHSFVGALSVLVDDAPEPTRSEFRRAIAEEQLGIPLEQALGDVAVRMDCPDLDQVALVAALGRDTGGNTAEVLDRVTDTIRERSELRRLIRTLTTQGRLSRWIVSALPPFLMAAILVINPKYLQPLFDHSAGRVLLVLATLMVISGSLVIRRIVNIKV